MTALKLTKKCTICKVEKPVSEFYKDKNRGDGLGYVCKSCAKDYRVKNCEKTKIYKKEYRIKNIKKIKERLEKTKVRRARVHKEWENKNKEQRIKYRKEYYKINKNELLYKAKLRNTTEKAKMFHRSTQSRRRARKKDATIEMFSAIEVFERDGYRCQICGKKTRPDFKNNHHPLYPNLDHIIPLSKGGEHSKLNTQCLCHQCNMEKHNNEYFGDQQRLFG